MVKINIKVSSEVRIDDNALQNFLKNDSELNRIMAEEARSIAADVRKLTAATDEPWDPEVWKQDLQHRGRWIVAINRGNEDENSTARFREAENGYFHKAVQKRKSAARRRGRGRS